MARTSLFIFSRQSAKTYKFQSQFKFQPKNQFIHPEGNEHIPKRVVPFELHTWAQVYATSGR